MSLQHRRLLQLFAVLAAWAVIVVARLAYIQIVRHADYVAKAKGQQERTLELAPVRGAIRDVRGRILAESVAAESIYADPQAIADRRAAARVLAGPLRMNARDIEQKLAGGGAFVWLARQLPLDVAAQIKNLRVPGIYTFEEQRRSYPRGVLAANVVGYAGVDGNGLAGIEHSFDRWVRGKPGKVTLLRDARRSTYLVGAEGANRPVDGNDVVLTIDAVIQFITKRALGRAVDAYPALGGAATGMDPNDGAILAMASVPTFDPNRFGDFPPPARATPNLQDGHEPA